LIANVNICRTDIIPLQRRIKQEQTVIALFVKISSYLDKKKEYDKVESLRLSLWEIWKKKIPLCRTIGYETWTNELLRKITNYSEDSKQHNEVEALVVALSTLKDKLEVERDWLTVEEHYSFITRQIEDYTVASVMCKSVVSIISTLENLNNQKLRLIKQLEIDRIKYEKLLVEHKMCPLCGSTINKRMVDKILSV
jgi:hypothetical protein